MHALAHTHTHTRIQAHAEMYARIFAFLIRRKRQHGDWSTVSTCACTTGGKGDSYGEAKSIERDAGKSACTRTQQRQQRRQQRQQQRQHPPMISPSRSLPDRSSLLFLSSNFLSFSRFYRREGWKPSASRWMPLTTLRAHPSPPPLLQNPLRLRFNPSLSRAGRTRPRVLNVLTTECQVILQV